MLSNREQQTLALIADGLATKHIAEQLNISVDTVETHRKNLLRKLNAVNMAEAVARAFRNKLLQ
ncbi:MAG: LuxR C-terminal-related transcriptional regulator [Chitinophagales bacterium]